MSLFIIANVQVYKDFAKRTMIFDARNRNRLTINTLSNYAPVKKPGRKCLNGCISGSYLCAKVLYSWTVPSVASYTSQLGRVIQSPSINNRPLPSTGMSTREW